MRRSVYAGIEALLMWCMPWLHAVAVFTATNATINLLKAMLTKTNVNLDRRHGMAFVV